MADRLDIRQWVRAETLVETTMMSDADVNAIIDQATLDISTRFNWPFLAETADIAFVADQQEYDLPANFHRLVAANVQGSTKRLVEVAPEEYWSAYGEEPAEGDPNFFLLWGNEILVTPVPTASTGGLRLRYYRTTTLMTADDDTPEWAPEFHMIVADYVCRHLWHREEDFSKAKVYDERYLDGIERMARFYLARAVDSPLIIGGGKSRYKSASDAWRFPWFP